MRPHRLAAGGLAVLALAASQGCASLGPRRHPEFTTRHPQLHTLAILPPDVEAYRLTFKGDQEMMYELLPSLREQVVGELERVLPKRGFTVKPLDLSEPVLQEHPELRQSLHAVREIFNKRLRESKQHPLSAFDYSVGSEINVFADYADCDALIYVHAEGIKKTGGEIAKDWTKTVLLAAATLGTVVIINSASITVIQMAVIDGTTGDILWYTNNLGDNEFDIAKPKPFRSRIRELITRFPKAGSVKPRPATTDRNVPAREPSRGAN